MACATTDTTASARSTARSSRSLPGSSRMPSSQACLDAASFREFSLVDIGYRSVLRALACLAPLLAHVVTFGSIRLRLAAR